MIMAGRPTLKMTTHARWVQRKVMVHSPASQENCARRCGVLAGLWARGRNLTTDSQNLFAMEIPLLRLLYILATTPKTRQEGVAALV